MSLQFIGKYEVVATLGHGSMGVVYKARDPEIGRIVAIKTLRSVFLSDDDAGNEAMKRFRQEARSAGCLHHLNIVTIYEAGKADNGSPYIVMEYIEGRSIETIIKDDGKVDAPAVLHYLAQVASAIDYAHAHNIIHRDIKPSNILVDNKHCAHLLDFGVAKISDTSLTPAGTVVGTPSYMSPEQIRGEEFTGGTDIFSLAVVAFEALTGKRPFPGKDFSTVVANIIHKPPLSFLDVGSDLPQVLEQVLKKGLSKEKTERFPTALDMIDTLAKSVGALVDSGGLVGGYHAGLSLKDIASPVMSAGGDAKEKGQVSTNSKSASPKIDVVNNSNAPTPSKKVDKELPKPTVVHREQAKDTKHQEVSQEAIQCKKSKRRGFDLWEIVMVVLVCVAFIGVIRFLPFDVLSVFSKQEATIRDSNAEIANNLPINSVSSAASAELSSPTSQVVTELRPNGSNNGQTSKVLDVAALKGIDGTYDKQKMSNLLLEQILDLMRANNTDVPLITFLLDEVGKKADMKFLEVIKRSLNHADIEVQVAAVKAIRDGKYFEHKEGFDVLVSSLYHKEYLTRGWAAKVLGTFPTEQSRRALLSRATSEDNKIVSDVIRRSLAGLGDGSLSDNKVEHDNASAKK